MQEITSVSELNDRKAISQTHAEAWREVQRIDQSLASYAFDYFPRGRIEYFAPGRWWLLFLDPKLNRGAFVAHLVVHWRLNAGRLTALKEPTYGSEACVGMPTV